MEPYETEKPQKQNYFLFLWKHLTAGQRWGIGALLLLLLIFPIAVIVALIPTNPFSRAGGTPPSTPLGATTILYTDPQSTDNQAYVVNTNQEFDVQVMIDTQLNTVSAAKIQMFVSKNILEVVGIDLSPYLPTILDEPVIDTTSDSANTLISFTVGSDAEDPKQGIGSLATLHLKAKDNDVMGTVGYTTANEVAAIGEDGNVLNFFNNLSILVMIPEVSPTPTQAPNSADLDIKFNLNTVTGKANDLPLTATLEMQNCNPCVQIPTNVIATNDDTSTYTASIEDISLGSNNEYKVSIKPDGFLNKAVGIITLLPGYNLITGDPNNPITITPGDLNNNGKVDIYDFTTVIEDYGSTNSPADFNRNGEVDIYDFTAVVEFYGYTGD